MIFFQVFDSFRTALPFGGHMTYILGRYVFLYSALVQGLMTNYYFVSRDSKAVIFSTQSTLYSSTVVILSTSRVEKRLSDTSAVCVCHTPS